VWRSVFFLLFNGLVPDSHPALRTQAFFEFPCFLVFCLSTARPLFGLLC
jgi:hypothetical protein